MVVIRPKRRCRVNPQGRRVRQLAARRRQEPGRREELGRVIRAPLDAEANAWLAETDDYETAATLIWQTATK
jgi:hypothetical protein